MNEGPTVEKKNEEEDDGGENVTKGPIAEEQMEVPHEAAATVSEAPIPNQEKEGDDASGDTINEDTTTENQQALALSLAQFVEALDPITPLSLVTLHELVNPPPTPSMKIIDVVPLRFIPASTFSRGVAAENLPNIFSANTQIPAPSQRPATLMFIPVNLLGLGTASPRWATTRKSPSKRRKKN